MEIALVAAVARNRVIGADNTLPWHIPLDLRHFKTLTRGRPVIMGRKTYQSIGRALPQRPNIILTRQTDFKPTDATVVSTIEAALKEAQKYINSAQEIMVIGGGDIYRQALPQATKLYLTEIDLEPEGDSYFPEFSLRDWHETEREKHIQEASEGMQKIAFSFVTYKRA